MELQSFTVWRASAVLQLPLESLARTDLILSDGQWWPATQLVTFPQPPSSSASGWKTAGLILAAVGGGVALGVGLAHLLQPPRRPSRERRLWGRNLMGTMDRRCPSHGPWIEHYKDLAGSTRSTCAAFGCGSYDIVGAHVRLDDGSGSWADASHYIVPLCRTHNHPYNFDDIPLALDVVRVSARRCP